VVVASSTPTLQTLRTLKKNARPDWWIRPRVFLQVSRPAEACAINWMLARR
jgi:hypothetical protein